MGKYVASKSFKIKVLELWVGHTDVGGSLKGFEFVSQQGARWLVATLPPEGCASVNKAERIPIDVEGDNTTTGTLRVQAVNRHDGKVRYAHVFAAGLSRAVLHAAPRSSMGSCLRRLCQAMHE